MFDIVGFIREKIFRKTKLTSQNPGEELSEKQTTKLGYLLLYCMFFAILVSGYWTLSIIKHIPTTPTQAPYCIDNIVMTFENLEKYHYGDDYDDCTLSSSYPEFNFEEDYINIKPSYQKIISLLDEVNEYERKISDLKYNITNLENNYNTALTEQIAGENSGLFDVSGNQNKIKNSRTNIDSYEKEILVLTTNIKDIQTQNSQKISQLKQKLDTTIKEYNNTYFWYKFYIAILSLIFSLTVFVILYKIYVKQKLKNSPHTIIFSVATFAYGLIVLQVALLFIWDLIPDSFIELLSYIFSAFTPIVFLVQFLWPVLIIAFFGFFVYRIQKRLYSPQNILKRFIIDKKCPNCGNGVDYTKPFCPLCSHEIQIKCPSCNHLTVKGMPFCSSCGTKVTQEDTK